MSTSITTNASALKVVTAAQSYIATLVQQEQQLQVAATDDAAQIAANQQMVAALQALNASLPVASQVTGP